jgi:predicted short-subunit dehydrogenase-like oxidoreductase (DUF2520 family)
MKVIIIGSGNVATVLGRKIVEAGHEIIQVAGRNLQKVIALSSSLKAGYTTNFLEISMLADIYIISVSDVAISEVAALLKLNNKLVVHTAAAVSKDVLAESSENYGVLYPLQTLRKEITTIPVIPILVDANNEQTKKRLIAFVSGWADNVSVATDEERLKLHLAAVFVNNFTNHLFAVAEEFCNNNKLNYKLLEPIIEETILRIEEYPASMVQTGPAIRKDFRTMEKHQRMLENNLPALQVYNVLSNSIIEFYDRKKV